MNLSELNAQELAHVLKKIEELQQSDGWAMMKQIMGTERETFFRKMSSPTASIVPEVVHYNRGIIEGSYRVADLPDKLIVELKNHLNLLNAQAAAQQATAAPLTGGTP